MIGSVSRLSALGCRTAFRAFCFSATRSGSRFMLNEYPSVGRNVSVRAFGTHICANHVNSGDMIGRELPSFRTSAVIDGAIADFDSSEYFRDSYGLLVFYPLDFTFVCPSELLGFSERLSDFESRGIKVVGVSVDSVFSHLAWLHTDLKNGGVQGVKIPLLSDISRTISKSVGLLRSDGFAQRASVLIDKSGKVRHLSIFDLGIGRSVDETLRVFDAIKFNDESGQVCPVNWKKGGDSMAPTSASTGAYLAKTFSKGALGCGAYYGHTSGSSRSNDSVLPRDDLITDYVYFDLASERRYLGRVLLGLYGRHQPLTCENFVQMCKGYEVDGRLIGYRNSPVSHVFPRNGIVLGDLFHSGSRLRSCTIFGRSMPEESFDVPFVQEGDVAMFSSGDESGLTSRFLITLTSNPYLGRRPVVIGTVVKGMKLIRSLGNEPIKDGVPLRDIR
ncbi:Peroxiredoxin-2 [Babesia sp. Xinjiang]|uniref:Peroxiredoxin-2 n=1 Tax=Babesia sp. Xinjiang TaxID=462227 RepID=UPI000A22852D|nr:Peroxiredoxin-2 [Babesia sp. Xinjiang]ORM40258.1 Peroxiredoxin-2 [Babesia sp. Xinjiang]